MLFIEFWYLKSVCVSKTEFRNTYLYLNLLRLTKDGVLKIDLGPEKKKNCTVIFYFTENADYVYLKPL